MYDNVANCIVQMSATSIRRTLKLSKKERYSMRRKNSISANIFIWLYLVAISIFVVWLGRFAPVAK